MTDFLRWWRPSRRILLHVHGWLPVGSRAQVALADFLIPSAPTEYPW